MVICIMTAAQYSVNAEKVVRYDTDSFNRDNEAVANRKRYSKQSGGVSMLEFIILTCLNRALDLFQMAV